MAESISDYKSHYSDWRNNDAIERIKRQEEYEANKKFKNHRFNQYEHQYSDGSEVAMDVPMSQVAKAFALPFFIASICGYFINQNAKKPKGGNQDWIKEYELYNTQALLWNYCSKIYEAYN